MHPTVCFNIQNLCSLTTECIYVFRVVLRKKMVQSFLCEKKNCPVLRTVNSPNEGHMTSRPHDWPLTQLNAIWTFWVGFISFKDKAEPYWFLITNFKTYWSQFTLNTDMTVLIRLLVLRLRDASGSIIGPGTSNGKGRFSGFLQPHRVKRHIQRISQNSPQILFSTFLPIHHSQTSFFLCCAAVYSLTITSFVEVGWTTRRWDWGQERTDARSKDFGTARIHSRRSNSHLQKLTVASANQYFSALLWNTKAD